MYEVPLLKGTRPPVTAGGYSYRGLAGYSCGTGLGYIELDPV